MNSTGAWVFSARLHDPDTATVVRVANGEILTTDGGLERRGGRQRDRDSGRRHDSRRRRVLRLRLEQLLLQGEVHLLQARLQLLQRVHRLIDDDDAQRGRGLGLLG